MSDELKTNHIFLDTEVFVAENFYFGTDKLAELVRLVERGEIHILMSEVTVAECRVRIRKMIGEANRLLLEKENRRTLGILRQANALKEAFSGRLDETSICAEIIGKLEKFLTDARVTICPLKPVSIERLFSDYASGNPPFGVGQKKDQFPDAAAMLSVGEWCKAHSRIIYVISKDADIKSVCAGTPFFIYLSGVSEFLNIFNENRKALAEFIHSLLALHNADLKQRIVQAFSNSNFRLRGEPGQVYDIEVSDLESVTIDNTNIISLQDDYALVEVEATIYFEASISYEDYSNATFDDDTSSYMGVETKYVGLHLCEVVTAEVEIEFTEELSQKPKFHVGIINTPIEIRYSVEDPDHWK